MSSGSDSELFDMSPEIPPLPPPVSRIDREFSKVTRKKLNFEEVGHLLDSPAGTERQSKGKMSGKGAGRPENSERVPLSQTSKLRVLARGYSNATGKDKTKGALMTLTQPRVSTSATKHQDASSTRAKGPSKTPPTIYRHSETTTPRIHPRPLTSLSNPERRSGRSNSTISIEPFRSDSSGVRTTPEGTQHSLDKQASTTGESRKRASSSLSGSSSSDPEPPTKRNSIESQLTKILQEVQRANTRLDSYDDKLDSLQERLQKLEEKPTSSSVSSSDTSVTKRKVPPEIRVSATFSVPRYM